MALPSTSVKSSCMAAIRCFAACRSRAGLVSSYSGTGRRLPRGNPVEGDLEVGDEVDRHDDAAAVDLPLLEELAHLDAVDPQGRGLGCEGDGTHVEVDVLVA